MDDTMTYGRSIFNGKRPSWLYEDVPILDPTDQLQDDFYQRTPPEWTLIPGGFLRSKLAGAP